MTHRPQHRTVSRGLAVAAVAALSATGLAVAGPAAPAQAAGPGVVMLSLSGPGNDASVRYDGIDTTVRLTAQRLDPSATITFQVNPDPLASDATAGWVTVPGTVSTLGDFAELDWAPDAALLGKEVAVRAVSTAPGGLTYSTRQGVAIARADWATEAVSAQTDFDPNQGSVGYFKQPYAGSGRTGAQVAVEGQTSATTGTVQVGWWDPASQAFAGKVDAAVEPYALKAMSGATEQLSGGQFHAALDITAFGPAAGKVIAIGAQRDTDDVDTAPLYEQTVGSISATAPTAPAGQQVPVVVSVYDTAGPSHAVAGAEVRRSADGSLVGYTDGFGQVRDTGTSGSLGSYYVNTTDVDAYDPAVDKQAAVQTVTGTADEVAAIAQDGTVFDNDEYAAGDLRLQLLNGFGGPVGAGQQAEYRLYATGATPPATWQAVTSDANGRAAVAFSPSAPGGDYTLELRIDQNFSSRFLRFTAGDGTLTPAPAAVSVAPGGRAAVTATLTVGGKPLPGRGVDAAYQRGVELVPGTGADAGLESGSGLVLTRSAATDVFGRWVTVVADRVESPQPAETGGRLTVTTRAGAGGNPAESAAVPVDFGSAANRVAGTVTVKGKSAGKKDRLTITGGPSLAGESVVVFRVGGKKVKLKGLTLDANGAATVKVKDKNGKRKTKYRVELLTSTRVLGSTSKKVSVR